MDDGFGVRVAPKRNAIGLELRAEFLEVFDNAVLDDGNFNGLVEMGMGIDLIRFAVCGPARVPNAD